MARKRQTTKTIKVRNAPTLAKIEADLAHGDLATAMNGIQVHHNLHPSPESARLFRKTLEAYLQEAIDRNDPRNFDRFWTLTDALAVGEPAWVVAQAMLLAKFGRLPQALMQLPADASDASRALLLGHAADRAIRFRSYAGLPEELHADCKTITLAFAKYDKADDEAARELLSAIGLQSPFLEWKVLLRGLMASAASDMPRALENWQRLHPDRMPAKIIAPLRATLEPAYRESLPPFLRAFVQYQSSMLNATGITRSLEALRAVVGRMMPLESAWPDIDSAWAVLKPTHPQLAQRLKNVIYLAVIQQGEPRDVERFRRVFGTPADDPDFHRLNAMALEGVGDMPQAMSFWERYERWLATKPAGWSEPFLAAARAQLMMHLGDLASAMEVAESGPQDIRQAMQELFGKPKVKLPRLKAADYFEKAAFHDPTSTAPLVKMVKLHGINKNMPAAEAAAKQALERDPRQQEVLESYASLLEEQGRFAEAFAMWMRAENGNPLDTAIANRTAAAGVGLARRAFADGHDEDARHILAEHSEQFVRGVPISFHALTSTMDIKDGKTAEADERLSKLNAVPNSRLAGLLYRSVDAALGKLKPAKKSAANKALTEAMKLPATPLEIERLYAAHASLERQQFVFRGQKTFEGKIHKLILSAVTATHPEAEFETLLLAVAKKQQWKLLAKIALVLHSRHQSNHAFMFFADLGWEHTKRYHVSRLHEDYDADLSARTDDLGQYYKVMKTLLEARRQLSDLAEDGFDDDDNLFDIFEPRR